VRAPQPSADELAHVAMEMMASIQRCLTPMGYCQPRLMRELVADRWAVAISEADAAAAFTREPVDLTVTLRALRKRISVEEAEYLVLIAAMEARIWTRSGITGAVDPYAEVLGVAGETRTALYRDAIDRIDERHGI